METRQTRSAGAAAAAIAEAGAKAMWVTCGPFRLMMPHRHKVAKMLVAAKLDAWGFQEEWSH